MNECGEVREATLSERVRRALDPELTKSRKEADELICYIEKEMAKVREQSYSEVRRLRKELDQTDNIIKGLAGYIGMFNV